MANPDPKPGSVINYAYLWRDQERQGREESIKYRPCMIANVYHDQSGQQRVGVMPITHSHQSDPDRSIEIPLKVTQHLGLDDDKQWIITQEFNDFIWPGSDVYPITRGKNKGQIAYGEVPGALFEKARDQQITLAKEKKLSRVKRDFDPRAEMAKYREEMTQSTDKVKNIRQSQSEQDKDRER